MNPASTSSPGEFLEITFFLEIEIQRQRDRSHHGHGGEITVAPFQFGHEFEVHAVDARNGGDHDEYCAPGGEPLHRHVELIGCGSQVDFERARQDIPDAVELLGDPDQMVVNIAEVNKIPRLNEWEIMAGELVKNLPLGGDSAADVDQQALKRQKEVHVLVPLPLV